MNPCIGVQPPDRGDSKSKVWLYPQEVHALLACPGVDVGFRALCAAPALSARRRTKKWSGVASGVRGDRGPFGDELLIGQPLLAVEDPARPEPEGPDLFVDVGCRAIGGGLKSRGHAVKHMSPRAKTKSINSDYSGITDRVADHVAHVTLPLPASEFTGRPPPAPAPEWRVRRLRAPSRGSRKPWSPG